MIINVLSPKLDNSPETALSIEETKVPTPIIAKTPIDILKRVRTARSLFFPTESNANTILSEIFIIYSYLNESTGSRFDALIAGIKPAKIPTKIETIEAITNNFIGIKGDRNVVAGQILGKRVAAA